MRLDNRNRFGIRICNTKNKSDKFGSIIQMISRIFAGEKTPNRGIENMNSMDSSIIGK